MNYQKLGFKCGVECHQQLEGKKLFCSCPAIIKDDKPDFIVRRKLRASAGEKGAVDIAAKFIQSGISFVFISLYAQTVMNKNAVVRIIVSNIKTV